MRVQVWVWAMTTGAARRERDGKFWVADPAVQGRGDRCSGKQQRDKQQEVGRMEGWRLGR